MATLVELQILVEVVELKGNYYQVSVKVRQARYDFIVVTLEILVKDYHNRSVVSGHVLVVHQMVDD